MSPVRRKTVFSTPHPLEMLLAQEPNLYPHDPSQVLFERLTISIFLEQQIKNLEDKPVSFFTIPYSYPSGALRKIESNPETIDPLQVSPPSRGAFTIQKVKEMLLRRSVRRNSSIG